ncbi:hypothetical protein ACHQM5_011232 [Ranunculus cassubicifolius]
MAGNNDRAKVYVGNIDFQAKEEEIISICEEIGPVVSLHLVKDKDHSDRHKGCCFCEYRDEETALSAIRNLKGRNLKGRQLRVDFPESVKKASNNGGSDNDQSKKRKRVGDDDVLAKPAITQIDSNLMITLHLMRNYSADQLDYFLEDLKNIETQDKEKAEQLLAICPSLPESIQQAKRMLQVTSTGSNQLPVLSSIAA